MEGAGEAFEVLGTDVDDAAAAGAIDIGDEEEGNGENDGQDKEEKSAPAEGHVTDQQVAEDGDEGKESPGGMRDAVAPGGLGIALGAEHIVRGDDGERGENVWLGGSRAGYG